MIVVCVRDVVVGGDIGISAVVFVGDVVGGDGGMIVVVVVVVDDVVGGDGGGMSIVIVVGDEGCAGGDVSVVVVES